MLLYVFSAGSYTAKLEYNTIKLAIKRDKA